MWPEELGERSPWEPESVEEVPKRKELESGKSSLIVCAKHRVHLEQTQRSIATTLRNALAPDRHPQKARQNVQPEPNRRIA